MARMPQAQWLGERSPRNDMSRYDIVCVHTIVGFAPAHAAHFSVHQGGTIQQSRDTRYRSAANLDGNHRVISIENEDHGSAFPSWSGSNVPALTDAQVEANAQILAWAHKTHGVPLQLCPNSRPTSRGLAYHRQGIDGNFGPFKYGGRVSGGENWSTSFGKVCPGDRRIDQLPAILARAKQIVNGTQPQEDDMTPEQADMLKDLHVALTNGNRAQVKHPHNDGESSVRYGVQQTWRNAWIVRMWRVRFYKEHWSVKAGIMTESSFLVPTALRNIWAHTKQASAHALAAKQAAERAEARSVANTALLERIVDADESTSLTGDEVRQIVDQALQENVVRVEVSIEAQEDDDSAEQAAEGVEEENA